MDIHCSPEATVAFDAKPCAFTFVPSRTALLVIGIQHFVPPSGGFGEPGPEPGITQCIEPAADLLNACRSAGLTVLYLRESSRHDITEGPSGKITRQAHVHRARDGIIDELQPIPGEVVIDRCGEGAFLDTDLLHKLKARAVTHVLVTYVAPGHCAFVAMREARERGIDCCAVTEATAGYNHASILAGVNILPRAKKLSCFAANHQTVLDALSPLSALMHSAIPPSQPTWDGKIDIPSLRASYRAGVCPTKVTEALYAKIRMYENINPGSWIRLPPLEDTLAAAAKLIEKFPDRDRRPPLFGIPFSMKDSIDVVGIPTTTACRPLVYTPTSSAPIYDAVIEQGALFMGKANLDQLATGMTGQRSPYGAPSSAVNTKYISGGSSSGSCVHVGAGLVSFSFGTDTAGSGRVPAAFNGVVGFKPTRGTISMVGITPACQSIDSVAIIAPTIQDARTVWLAMEYFDPRDPYAKGRDFRKNARLVNGIGPGALGFRFGIPPPEVLGLCCPPYQRLFAETVRHLQGMGGVVRPINWEPFEKAGQLLYDGSFVHERLTCLPDHPSGPAAWLTENQNDLHPVILDVFRGVLDRKTSPVDVFRDLQAQRRYTAQVQNQIFSQAASGVDVVVMPTAPTHWTVEEVRRDPIAKNSALGLLTHNANVLDLCAVSCPAGTFDAGEIGGEGILPFGVMFLAGSGMDCEVLDIATRFEQRHRVKDTQR